MRDLLFFAIAASVSGTVFFVALLELFFTIRRRKANRQLQSQIKEIRATYTETLNKAVKEDEAKIEAVEKQLAATDEKLAKEKEALEEEFNEKIETVTAKAEKQLAAAKARAKRLEEEAKLKAEEYLASRQKEVEQDLMNLVMTVTKKVLPAGLTYSVQKELVMEALRDAKLDNGRRQ